MKTLILGLVLASVCPAADTPARKERTKAFSSPLTFSSSGTARWGLFSADRAARYELAPVLDKGSLVALKVTLTQAGKVTNGRLEVGDDGSFSTTSKELTNVCNVGSICPGVRQRLASGQEVDTDGKVETAGTVRSVSVHHALDGAVAEDGSMKVVSKAKSQDGKVVLTTTTILAPDGLPWLSDTAGRVTKGLVDIRVTAHLERK